MSATTKLENPSDLSFEEYNRWQNNAVLIENIRNQSFNLKSTDKYVFNGEDWLINDYEGFAIISTVNGNPENEHCFNRLVDLKHDLESRFKNKDSYYWLPEESYHQTIANTLSNEKFKVNIKEPGLVNQYSGIIETAFKKITVPSFSTPVAIQMLGFNVFGSCIALLGVFENEYDYQRILSFRKQFYSDPVLNNHGIKLTRPFIGHITFAYLGKELTDNEREELTGILTNLNTMIESMKIVFKISIAELRYFKNLSKFHKEPEYPTFNFTTDN